MAVIYLQPHQEPLAESWLLPRLLSPRFLWSFSLNFCTLTVRHRHLIRIHRVCLVSFFSLPMKIVAWWDNPGEVPGWKQSRGQPGRLPCCGLLASPYAHTAGQNLKASCLCGLWVGFKSWSSPLESLHIFGGMWLQRSVSAIPQPSPVSVSCLFRLCYMEVGSPPLTSKSLPSTTPNSLTAGLPCP